MLFTIKFESFDRNRVSKRKTTCLEYGSLLVLDNDFFHHQLVTQIGFIWFRMKGTWSKLHMIKTEFVFSRGMDIFPILWYKQKIKKIPSLALSVYQPVCLSVSGSLSLSIYAWHKMIFQKNYVITVALDDLVLISSHGIVYAGCTCICPQRGHIFKTYDILVSKNDTLEKKTG